MDMIFYIFLAGCTHDAALCEPLSVERTTAASQVVCEEMLGERMAGLTAEWPVFMGDCRGAMPDALAAAPAWWPETAPGTVVGDAPRVALGGS